MTDDVRTICWLRRDLRLADNMTLSRATMEGPTLVAFVFDPNILDALEDRDDRRVSFIYRSLRELDAKLREYGSALVVRFGDPVEEVPKLAAEWKARYVFGGRDFEPYAVARDSTVSMRLQDSGCSLCLSTDHLILEPSELKTGAGRPYSVFTPFMKAWRAALDVASLAPHNWNPDELASIRALGPMIQDWPIERAGFEETDTWIEAGEAAAAARLEAFKSKLDGYADARDFPSLAGTSALSPHLRFGTISIRACVRTAIEAKSPGGEKWLNELIWREFYQHVLEHWPHVADRPFRPEYEGLHWPGYEAHFEAWKEGQTGFPIVDAAMRCLKETGWMHNRLRMIVASFLTKDLLVDYRKGEAHFARYLLDFELASNNGGWQWCASTGCDAQPYFRIFNPWLQSAKFDPDGAFIRRWVPEVAGFSNARLHAMHEVTTFEALEAGCEIGVDYPAPIVDHQVQKALALKLLESVRKTSGS